MYSPLHWREVRPCLIYADRPETIVSAGVRKVRIYLFGFNIISIESVWHMRKRPLFGLLFFSYVLTVPFQHF
jgi:hypothetical protein